MEETLKNKIDNYFEEKLTEIGIKNYDDSKEMFSINPLGITNIFMHIRNNIGKDLNITEESKEIKIIYILK